MQSLIIFRKRPVPDIRTTHAQQITESRLKVIAHSPAFWFLLTKDSDLFLDINCEHGPVSYDVLIMLNEEERAQYSAHGQNYLNTLAEAVNYSAPGARGNDSVYKGRNISRERGQAVAMAIEAWKSQSSGC